MITVALLHLTTKSLGIRDFHMINLKCRILSFDFYLSDESIIFIKY